MESYRVDLEKFSYQTAPMEKWAKEESIFIESLKKVKAQSLINFDNNYFLGMSVVQIAGKRLKVELLSEDLSVFNEERIFLWLLSIAKEKGCDLIQLALNPKGFKNISLPVSYYASNLVMGLNLSDVEMTKCDDLKYDIVSVEDCPVEKLALRELEARWMAPGSTVHELDTYNNLIEDYKGLLSGPDSNLKGYGVYEGDKLIALNLWQEISVIKLAIGHFIWVDPSKRGEGLGHWLRNDRKNKLKESGIMKIMSFLSLQNISARKTLIKNGFDLEMIIVNAQVLK